LRNVEGGVAQIAIAIAFLAFLKRKEWRVATYFKYVDELQGVCE
jgi:hypothetical protein